MLRNPNAFTRNNATFQKMKERHFDEDKRNVLLTTFTQISLQAFSILDLTSTLMLYLNDGNGLIEVLLLCKILQQLKMSSEAEALHTCLQ